MQVVPGLAGRLHFIDLGKVLEPSGTVPVTIKSLVFQFWRRADQIDVSNLRTA